jgi:hypothetical protein
MVLTVAGIGTAIYALLTPRGAVATRFSRPAMVMPADHGTSGVTWMPGAGWVVEHTRGGRGVEIALTLAVAA